MREDAFDHSSHVQTHARRRCPRDVVRLRCLDFACEKTSLATHSLASTRTPIRPTHSTTSSATSEGRVCSCKLAKGSRTAIGPAKRNGNERMGTGTVSTLRCPRGIDPGLQLGNNRNRCQHLLIVDNWMERAAHAYGLSRLKAVSHFEMRRRAASAYDAMK
eukprot:6214501-Pleurochrysis_carterae.AAC.1